MEDDKKKKRNRKKKNKQATNTIENVTLDARESTPDNKTNVPETGRNNNGQVSGIIDANGTEGVNLAKDDKEYWGDREASFQEKIKELQSEKDAQIQKEALLEERIKQLLTENDETAKKESGLEKKIQQLQSELDGHLQKEASLETRIQQLKGEKDSWVQIENSTKESIASLTIDNTKLRAQVIELEQSREGLLAETLKLKEIISSQQLHINNLESAASSLHSSMNSKVTSEDGDATYQIEAARALVERLLTENSELVEKVNELYAELDRRGLRTEEQVSSPDSVPGAVTAQSADIADDSTKMPNLTVEVDDRDRTTQATDSVSDASKMMSVSGSNQSLEDIILKDIADDSTKMPNLTVEVDDRDRTTQATDSVSDASKMMSVSGSNQSLEDIILKDNMNREHVNVNGGPGISNYSEIMEAGEIVQIPLDENEIKGTNLEVAQNDEKTEIPITDAPLIGAPFRFISFFARYVSGADLVEKNTGK